MQANDIDFSLIKFDTYKEYLDSFKLPEDSHYMRSTQIIKLGYRSQRPVYSSEEFYMRRENLEKLLNSKILDIPYSSFLKGHDLGLRALAEREESNALRKVSTIIFLQMRQRNGFDISGYIDYEHSLRSCRLKVPDSIDWKAIFEARILLRPRMKDLCFFDWQKGKISSNDTDNYQTLTHPDYGLCFKHKGDHKHVQVTSKKTPFSGNVIRTMVKSKLYGIIVLYDHPIKKFTHAKMLEIYSGQNNRFLVLPSINGKYRCQSIANLKRMQNEHAVGIEPLSIGAAVGLGAVGYGFFKDQTYCRYYECCDTRSIPGDTEALERYLTNAVYGQHIVAEHIVKAIRAHFSNVGSSRKSLVISFHGQPGTGKNFVAEHIAKALYTKGSESRFVHKFLGRADFPEAKHVDIYKKRIDLAVRNSLKACPRSLFIFDEVDKMPSGIFDALASFADYNAFTDGTDNTKAIFIFLSNTAGAHIMDHLGTLMNGGTLREDTRLSDFEPLLKKAAYNIEGGLQKTSLIEAHVIDHYMPFLPLEKSHVRMCLEAEFRVWNQMPKKEIIDDILSSLIVYDRKHGMFASSGCKTLEKKVAMALN